MAVSDYAISAVRVREEGDIQYPVYYVGKRMFDVDPLHQHGEACICVEFGLMKAKALLSGS